MYSNKIVKKKWKYLFSKTDLLDIKLQSNLVISNSLISNYR